jgi:hypothetical protein
MSTTWIWPHHAKTATATIETISHSGSPLGVFALLVFEVSNTAGIGTGQVSVDLAG